MFGRAARVLIFHLGFPSNRLYIRYPHRAGRVAEDPSFMKDWGQCRHNNQIVLAAKNRDSQDVFI